MRICVFASGGGSNFKAILKAKSKGFITSGIPLLITNNSNCFATVIARKNGVSVVHISRSIYPELNEFDYANIFLKALDDYKIDTIILAGYMKMIEKPVIEKFRNRILNIHPALLPSFGGKGYYGLNVHKAVIEKGVKISGLTIHLVNENYDEGRILFQKAVKVKENDNEYTLQKRILKYEHKCYPIVIGLIEKNIIKIG